MRINNFGFDRLPNMIKLRKHIIIVFKKLKPMDRNVERR